MRASATSRRLGVLRAVAGRFLDSRVYGAPGGNKADIADKLRRTAADARRNQG